ncbi:PepSY1/2 domain-containing protein [Dethiobacter alkaliphilus]|uniref:Sporulation protein YpeB PepSY1 and PepSY2 domain-containing protein n=1 Tax=Dethiobacter alkaliphilus AHT 1 TaxID=555088 RepID=C0GK90_DETAL|nr:PepSY1/2 domain-containing protein [Dethiobacter alkaliphilus]EEG76273.1 hypothetical protein DealDRAFT_2899 [Dethiobacter alkaliphilus AHT 1]
MGSFLQRIPWVKVLVILLVISGVLINYQYRQITQMQSQIGGEIQSNFTQMGLTVRDMRIKSGSVMAGEDRQLLENINPNSASGSLSYLPRHSNKPFYFYNLQYFLEYVESGLYYIGSKDDPLSDEDFAYLRKVHDMLLQMEDIFIEENPRFSNAQTNREFYLGKVWPEVLEKMESLLGDDLQQIYTVYVYPHYDPQLEPENRLGFSGPEVTQDEAFKVAKDFFPLPDSEYAWQLTGEGWSSDWGDSWTFSAIRKGDNSYEWQVEVLATGGNVISLRKTSNANFGDDNLLNDPPEPVISEQTAINNALEFLSARGIKDVYPLYTPNYGISDWGDAADEGRYQFSLVRKIDNIFIPEHSIEFEVSGQTGEITSFYNHQFLLRSQSEISIPEPKLSRDEARQGIDWLLLPVDGPTVFHQFNEELFYTFIAKESEASYIIYINAITGERDFVDYLYNGIWSYD